MAVLFGKGRANAMPRTHIKIDHDIGQRGKHSGAQEPQTHNPKTKKQFPRTYNQTPQVAQPHPPVNVGQPRNHPHQSDNGTVQHNTKGRYGVEQQQRTHIQPREQNQAVAHHLHPSQSRSIGGIPRHRFNRKYGNSQQNSD